MLTMAQSPKLVNADGWPGLVLQERTPRNLAGRKTIAIPEMRDTIFSVAEPAWPCAKYFVPSDIPWMFLIANPNYNTSLLTSRLVHQPSV